MNPSKRRTKLELRSVHASICFISYACNAAFGRPVSKQHRDKNIRSDSYSPKCVEGEFREVGLRHNGVLRSSLPAGNTQATVKTPPVVEKDYSRAVFIMSGPKTSCSLRLRRSHVRPAR